MGIGLGQASLAQLSPQQQQMLLQQLSQQRPQQPQAQAPQIPTMQMPAQAGVPQLGGPQAQGDPQQPRLGGPNTLLPSGAAMAQVPGVVPTPTLPRGSLGTGQPRKTQASGIAALPMAVAQISRNQQEKKVQKIKALTEEFLTIASDPAAQRNIQQVIKNDPQMAKIFEKKQNEFAKIYHKAAEDSSSVEAQGVQLGYKNYQAQDDKRVAAQEALAQMQYSQSRAREQEAMAQKNVADANKANTQASQMGQVTPAMIFNWQQKLSQTSQTTKAMLDAIDRRMNASITNTNTRALASVQNAKIRAGATRDAAAIRAQNSQNAQNSITKEYKALHDQAMDLDTQAKDLHTRLGKAEHLLYNDPDYADIMSQLNEVESQRQVLASQYQMLQMKDMMYQQNGLIGQIGPPLDTTTPPPGSRVYDFTKH